MEIMLAGLKSSLYDVEATQPLSTCLAPKIMWTHTELPQCSKMKFKTATHVFGNTCTCCSVCMYTFWKIIIHCCTYSKICQMYWFTSQCSQQQQEIWFQAILMSPYIYLSLSWISGGYFQAIYKFWSIGTQRPTPMHHRMSVVIQCPDKSELRLVLKEARYLCTRNLDNLYSVTILIWRLPTHCSNWLFLLKIFS